MRCSSIFRKAIQDLSRVIFPFLKGFFSFSAKQYQPAFGARHYFSVMTKEKLVKFSRVFQPIQGFFNGDCHSRGFPGFQGFKDCQITCVITSVEL